MASTRPTIGSVIKANPDTFRKLVRYSVAIFGLSLGSFLALHFGLADRLLGISDRATRDTLAAGVGVLVANLVVAAYAWDAFHAPDDEPQPIRKKTLAELRSERDTKAAAGKAE